MNSPFDELGQNPEWTDEDRAKFEKIDYLIHQTFHQNEHGRELLAIWRDALIKTPTAVHGMDVLGIGIEEGKKAFIRHIVQTIEKVESE